MEEVYKYLEQAEYLAEEILEDKQRIVNLDMQRHKNREALRAMSHRPQKKTWVSYSNMFIKMDQERASSMIEKDQTTLDQSISEIRDELKVKVNDLRKMEGKPELKGFNLKPLNSKELSSLKEIIPEVVNSDI